MIKLDIQKFAIETNLNAYQLFKGYTYLNEIHFINNWTSQVTNMSYMFDGCRNLKLIQGLNFENASSLAYCFNNCRNLLQVQSLNFYNTNVNLLSAFANCVNITTIGAHPSAESNVINLARTFYNCTKLGGTMPNFNTSGINSLAHTFYKVAYMSSSPMTLPNYNTNNVTTLAYTFYFAYINNTIPNFNLSKVTNMVATFDSAAGLNFIPNFNTQSVINMYRTLSGTWIYNAPIWNTWKVQNCANLFQGCYNLTNVPVYNLSSSTNVSYMFTWCNNLTQASLNNVYESLLTATKVSVKNLSNTNTSSPFYETVYSVSNIPADYQTRLTAAGWTF